MFETDPYDDAMQAVAELAHKDRAMAYWTDPNRFPRDDAAFWDIIEKSW